MLNPNPGLILWTIVTFILLLFLLRKIAWKPLLGVLAAREESVKNSIEKAEKAKEEAEKIFQENQKALEQASAEGQKILNESRIFAEKLKDDILEKANQQSRKMLDAAKEEIIRGKEAAMQELRSEIATIAVGAAGKIIDETLDENKHRKLVDSYMKELPKN
jgi:F-type H+-transporting ATPase subunit b